MPLAIPVTLNHVNKAALDDFVQGKTYKVILSVDAITAADDNISDLTEVSPGNGYAAGGPSITMTVLQEDADAYLLTSQPTITATGGDIGPYTGIGVYEVATGKLVGACNEVSPFTIDNGTAKVIQFNQSRGILHWGRVEP